MLVLLLQLSRSRQRMIACRTGTGIDLHIRHCKILLLLLLLLMQQLLGAAWCATHSSSSSRGSSSCCRYTCAYIEVAILVAAFAAGAAGDLVWLGCRKCLNTNRAALPCCNCRSHLLLLLMMLLQCVLLLLRLLLLMLLLRLETIRWLMILSGGNCGHSATIDIDIYQICGALRELIRLSSRS